MVRREPKVQLSAQTALRREHQVLLSAKAWLTVQSTFVESVLASALGEGLSGRRRLDI
jgi:hypothetical protein